jgi:hypothetical protein
LNPAGSFSENLLPAKYAKNARKTKTKGLEKMFSIFLFSFRVFRVFRGHYICKMAFSLKLNLAANRYITKEI